jgi:hypothetical protein
MGKEWQTAPNSQWFTEDELICDECKRSVKEIMEMVLRDKKTNFGRFCWDCFHHACERWKNESEDEFFYSRYIIRMKKKKVLLDPHNEWTTRFKSNRSSEKQYDIDQLHGAWGAGYLKGIGKI